MKGRNLFFATEKNIYDALHHKRITTSILSDILLRKGIILCEETTKEELIEEVCRLPHCYEDLQSLKELVQKYDQRESLTKVTLNTETNQNDLKKAIDIVKKIYAADKNGSISLNANKDGSILIDLNYQDIDLSKTELRQIDNRNVSIEFKSDDDKVNIRMPQTAKAREVVDLIQKQLSKIQDKSIDRFEISLETIIQPNLRSQFFQDLMNGLTGYEVDDVTNVVLNRSGSEESDSDDEDQNIDTGFVKKAVLNGEGVNTSSIFSQLHNKGYYISRIAWSAIPENRIGDRIIVEAFFKNADSCTDFSYNIKGINNQKGNEYNITIRPANSLEKQKISELIEISAEKAYYKIVSVEVDGHEKD
ncbi:hypothetical protein ACMVR2_001186 [Yersinia enterocolitica]